MNHLRHSGLYDASSLSATLIGCGGIGAGTALVLAKMGVGYLTLIDDDVVSDVNLPTQFHRLSDIGMDKVEAVSHMLLEFSDDTDIFCCCERITGEYSLNDFLVISAVDSIQARKDIWNAVVNGKVRWYIDARMAAEELHIHCVDMLDYGWYDHMLVQEDDSKVAELPCTQKSTIFSGAVSGGLIGSTVRKIVSGIHPPRTLVFNMVNNFLFSQV